VKIIIIFCQKTEKNRFLFLFLLRSYSGSIFYSLATKLINKNKSCNTGKPYFFKTTRIQKWLNKKTGKTPFLIAEYFVDKLENIVKLVCVRDTAGGDCKEPVQSTEAQRTPQ